ncbi:MAG: D-alanyl-D-alanine carboxypeptidase [Eubacteriales bacterium]|jgi:D-alanyl-D-alanine carboxypeptidase (penicillin-binding protein 5/6)|nr:D-alanyl-D-alanine carboxypeptidase [Eubacteriales bacterium]MDD4106052.1 D-alanyl-D-alanine carboxypeptidase [Eubacteriales bacterium]MDD4711361.1 D-alanyl-D-alanine carboxypeptidase [Eubacteriales bacterium]NLO14952.1 D-alanyl-D-alanine carboxypeptidase [Clostridiales bacterium]
MNQKRGMRVLTLMLCAILLLPAISVRASDEYSSTNPGDLSSDHLRAESAVLIEANTGNVVFEKNADVVRYPASTTKILTLLLGITMVDPDMIVVATPSSVSIPEDASSISLEIGQEVKWSDLLKATMVASGNDGANLIAETVSGSQEAFAALMNEAAYNFGATSTHFSNAHGLYDDYHVTTARDMAIIAREAMKNDVFREIAALSRFTLPRNNMNGGRSFTARDSIFKVLSEDADEAAYFYEHATGIKTGYVSQAGYCYVGSAYKDGIELISVVFQSSSYRRAFTDTIRLMDYGFSQYVSISVEQIYRENPKVIDISGFALDDPDLGRLALDIRKMEFAADDNLVSMASQPDAHMKVYNTRTQFQFTRILEAPVNAGETVGIMTYTPEDGSPPVTYELIAGRTIERREALAPTLAEIRQYADTDPNPFPPFSVEFLIIILLPVIAVAVLAAIFYRLLTMKRKPKLKQKNKYKTRFYR